MKVMYNVDNFALAMHKECGHKHTQVSICVQKREINHELKRNNPLSKSSVSF